MSVIPAYGRDYKSAKAAKAAWESGKVDFILKDMSSPWDGKYCSGRDFYGQSVEIRYQKKTRLVFGTCIPD